MSFILIQKILNIECNPMSVFIYSKLVFSSHSVCSRPDIRDGSLIMTWGRKIRGRSESAHVESMNPHTYYTLFQKKRNISEVAFLLEKSVISVRVH